MVSKQGRTHRGGGRRPGPPPLEPENTIFSGFLSLNYMICIFEVCFLSFLLCGRTEEGCSMVNSFRQVDFSHPTGQGCRSTDIIGRAQRLHRVPTNTKFDFLFAFWQFCSESRFSAFWSCRRKQTLGSLHVKSPKKIPDPLRF